MATRLALIPSPFVGVGSWAAMDAIMPEATTVDYGAVGGPHSYDGVARQVIAQVDAQVWLAVLHSGAGGFAPALAAIARNLTGFIFIDAVLPYPGRSWLENAPTALAAQLRQVRDNGLLERWNEWFSDDIAPDLVSDPHFRSAFNPELPRVPFSFLEAASPADGRWESVPTVYLQLSPLYAEEAERARQRGWRVRVSWRHCITMASHPEAVAVLLRESARILGSG